MMIYIRPFVLIAALGVGAAQAGEIRAFAYCPMTHAMGHGHGPNLSVALEKAKDDCVAKGGVTACCYKFNAEETKAERARVVGEADQMYPGH